MSDPHGTHSAKHPYHLVDPSPWPIVGAIAALALTVGGVLFMHGNLWGNVVMPLGFLGILATMFFWWRDVVNEGEHQAITVRWCRSACATAWRCSSPRR